MSFSIPTDCLNEVFENLEEDKIILHSCLLVSRVWCKISVGILWRNIWSFRYFFNYSNYSNRQLDVASAIFNTLIACLPNKSKELLHKNEVFISSPISKPPLFNYAAFCRILSINEIVKIVDEVLENDSYAITSLSLLDRRCLVTSEILKMFMNQVSSLKTLTCLNTCNINILNNIPFTSFPGTRDCLTDLSELRCSSGINYKLSQICHNLRILIIHLESEVSNELKELVSSQNNLKNLTLSASERIGWADIIPALTKHSSTLTKLHLYSNYVGWLPLSFVSSFLNLQEIKFSFKGTQYEDFKELQYTTFPKLQTLKIPYDHPKPEYMTKFLEINGKNLQELYIYGNALNSSIAKFCPNLKKLFTLFNNDELDVLKSIFNGCKYLEGISTWGGDGGLETIANHSPKHFHELKLIEPELFPEDLESFFISWKNRASKKLLSLIFIYYCNSSEENEEIVKIIEKYKNLGIIRKFEVRIYEEELYL